MATTAVNVEGAPILFQVLASALVRHVVDASGAGKKQAEFMGGRGKRVALWPKCPPLLGHHDGDSTAEQCQSHFHVLPAQSPRGSGSLPTVAPPLEEALGLSTPWQGCEPSCDHRERFTSSPGWPLAARTLFLARLGRRPETIITQEMFQVTSNVKDCQHARP